LACQLEQLNHLCITTFRCIGYYLFFIQYRYYQRLRILQAIAAHGVQLLPRTAAFESKLPCTTEQPITFNYLHMVACNLDQIRHIDFVLAALCFTALILTNIFIIVMKRKLAHRSSLYADIVTANEITQLKITDFPEATRTFSVAVPLLKLGLQVRSLFCCGIVTITEHPWRIFNSHTKTCACPHTFSCPHEKPQHLKELWKASMTANRLSFIRVSIRQ
jgi:hypothetical protein